MIDIKELFKSDLDPNSQTWWSNDKVDKINYNFYQLSSGGMYGPQGQIGPDGDFGPVGTIGSQGSQGYNGAQGPIGAGAESDWVYFPHGITTPGYLFPKPYNVSGIQYTPSVMKIGTSAYDVTEYDTPSLYSEYVVRSNINNTTTPESIKINLRLQHDSRVSDFMLTEDYELKVGKIVSGDPGFKIIHNARISSINTISGVSHIVDDNGAVTSVNAFLEDPSNQTISNDSFSYNVNAQTNYILTADNNAGNVSWKKKTDVLPSFPIGSIISIRESDFNSNNFHLTESINSNLSALDIRWGRGRVGTDYAGWYICNGNTWFLVGGGLSYLVPNLNSFNYSIAPNGAGQYIVTGAGNNDPIMIGGYDISLTGSYNVGTYDVSFTNTWSGNDTSIIPNTMGNIGTIPSYVTRMVHIIYLEKPTLIWRDNGAPTQSPTSL